MNDSHLFAVILAGGTGTRLWPRSRRERPKQLLDLLSPRTMLQETFDRIRPILPDDHIYVITNTHYVEEVCSQLPEIPPENVIGEPEGRGTAPAIGLAALVTRERDPEAVLLSAAADHSIQRPDEFREVVLAAAELASQDFLVTLGVQPNYPETGYGYIEAGEELGQVRGRVARRVRRFTEKPDAATAAHFVASGNYAWNSSIFIMRSRVLLEEFERYLPKHLAQLREVISARGPVQTMATFDHVWRQMKNETIDVGIMEKSHRVAVLSLDVGWSDVGSWATLHELLANGSHENAVVGKHIGINTRSSLIYSDGRLVATIGLENMIVVSTDDAILICPKEHAQQVREIVDELKRGRQDRYL